MNAFQNAARISLKVAKASFRWFRAIGSTNVVKWAFWLNGVKYGKCLHAIGIPSVNVSLGGTAEIGDGFHIRTGVSNTEVGSVGSRIRVGPKGVLKIGNHVGMSNATIVCDESVTIGDEVFIGGGVQIFDTNFHSTDAAIRTLDHEDKSQVRTAPVSIGSHVFVGVNAIICKGVVIGVGAVVAAGAVVVHSIPAGETWAGNPAKKVR
jgi:acetyltransferase-like isoleucine patch superfamily enzyme